MPYPDITLVGLWQTSAPEQVDAVKNIQKITLVGLGVDWALRTAP